MKKNKDSTRSASQYNGANYVGFANLPNQLYRKSVKDGFEFSLMVVGESGLGKSTLINSLFLTDVYSEEYPGPSQRVKKTLEVQKTALSLTENGIKLNLTVVDTPGFGDNVNNDKCWEPIQSYIDYQYENYLNQESRVNRPVHIHDTRVHVCLYFIAPSGHGLKPLDIEFMRRLHEKVNIVPLIAKADTMTPDECHDFKKEILREIQMHNINIYEFPDVSDEEENRLQKKLKQRVPFAVIGSNVVLQINDRRIRARQYPWGIAEVENEEHCDFKILRDMLIRTHMQDLVDVTSSVHYENFRAKKLAGVMPKNPSAKSPIEQMNEEKREHRLKMKKMEKEMETVFDTKVNEKRNKLKQSEQELMRKHEQQKKKYETDLAELEQRRREFERERDEWEERQKTIPSSKKPKDKTKWF
ncbi:Oidioi.mRNA.OKI2018_I69.PAR.g9443.t3.cds [Oikopleura dioica]|uniref:Septin n=1 Tax=Oikopleura dioica TaxID=34765 RepID=A0ABN7RKR4_OIKDI|nr:Oidioi.mRNA.OKI2018_I69.PAR.g9443.t3.cds [Oikopleura dioica]